MPTGAYCACNALNAEDYGYLYNWYAVNDSRGLAPEGWHIPSDEEWQILIDYLGGDKVAGGKMKSLNHWISPNKGATNKSGFSALPGGFCSSYGNFDDWHYYAYFWSSTSFTLETGGSYAWQRKLYTNLAEVTRDYLTKEWGLSVRCVKD